MQQSRGSGTHPSNSLTLTPSAQVDRDTGPGPHRLLHIVLAQTAWFILRRDSTNRARERNSHLVCHGAFDRLPWQPCAGVVTYRSAETAALHRLVIARCTNSNTGGISPCSSGEDSAVPAGQATTWRHPTRPGSSRRHHALPRYPTRFRFSSYQRSSLCTRPGPHLFWLHLCAQSQVSELHVPVQI